MTRIIDDTGSALFKRDHARLHRAWQAFPITAAEDCRARMTMRSNKSGRGMSAFPLSKLHLALAIIAAFTGTAHSDDQSAPKPPDGFIAIFNGKDLTGWEGSG